MDKQFAEAMTLFDFKNKYTLEIFDVVSLNTYNPYCVLDNEGSDEEDIEIKEENKECKQQQELSNVLFEQNPIPGPSGTRFPNVQDTTSSEQNKFEQSNSDSENEEENEGFKIVGRKLGLKKKFVNTKQIVPPA